MALVEPSNEKKSISQTQAHAFRIFGDVIQGFLGNILDTVALIGAGLIKSSQITRIVCEFKDGKKLISLPNLVAIRLSFIKFNPSLCRLGEYKTEKLTELEIIWIDHDENKYHSPMLAISSYVLRNWKLTKLRLDGYSLAFHDNSLQGLADMNLKELSLTSCSGMSLTPLRNMQFDKLIVPGYSMKQVADVFGERLPLILVTRGAFGTIIGGQMFKTLLPRH